MPDVRPVLARLLQLHRRLLGLSELQSAAEASEPRYGLAVPRLSGGLCAVGSELLGLYKDARQRDVHGRMAGDGATMTQENREWIGFTVIIFLAFVVPIMMMVLAARYGTWATGS